MRRAVLSLLGLLLGLAVYYFAPEAGRNQTSRPVPQQAPVSIPSNPSTDEEWSDTEPAINLEHVFEGQVNRHGKPIGFHSRPGGRDPAEARVVRRVSGPNALGVYIAEVEIRNGSGRWLK